jgi:hypothetical protein
MTTSDLTLDIDLTRDYTALYALAMVLPAAMPGNEKAHANALTALENLRDAPAFAFDGSELRVISASRRSEGVWQVTTAKPAPAKDATGQAAGTAAHSPCSRHWRRCAMPWGCAGPSLPRPCRRSWRRRSASSPCRTMRSPMPRMRTCSPPSAARVRAVGVRRRPAPFSER